MTPKQLLQEREKALNYYKSWSLKELKDKFDANTFFLFTQKEGKVYWKMVVEQLAIAHLLEKEPRVKPKVQSESTKK